MKVEKPNWTPQQLLANINRRDELMIETAEHQFNCLCSFCIECAALFRLTNTFSEDEIVEAVFDECERFKNDTE